MSAFHAEDRGSIPLGTTYRDVAQSGSAPALGAGCRGFKSLYPDQFCDRANRLLVTTAPVAHLDRASAF